MSKAAKLRTITNIYNILYNVTDDKDLRALRLTLVEYRAACDVLRDLGAPGNSTLTFMDRVAEFFRDNGFNVVPAGINFKISI